MLAEPKNKRFTDVLTRRPAFIKLAAAVIFLLVSAATLAQRAPGPSSSPFGLLMSLGPGVAFLIQFFQSMRAKLAKNVVVEPDAVVVDGYPILRRAEVKKVARKIASVEVGRGFFRAPCELTFAGEPEARAFEALLRAPPAEARPAIDLPLRMSPAMWITLSRGIPLFALAATIIGTFVLGAVFGPSYAFVPPAGFALFYVQATGVPRLTAGMDGVRVGRRFGDEFISYDRIRAVAGMRNASPFHRAAVILTLDHGARRFVGFGMDALAEQRAASSVGKIARQLAAFRGAPEPLALTRMQSTTAEWLAHLRGVAAGASGDHRSLAVGGDTIREALKNPRADAATRAAAAFAVATTTAGNTEVELMASRTVEPRLRTALEQIAHADPESFARVVDTLGAAR